MTRSKVLGTLLYFITYILHKTLKVRVVFDENFDHHQQYLAAFWHGKQYLPALEFIRYNKKNAILVSASRDGEILCVCLKKIGYKIIRGSSRRDNVSALLNMNRKLKQGYSLGLAVDGPLGPIHRVKPGLIYMANKFGVEIVPVGCAFSRKWVFKKAWDKFELPKPFSKAILYVGKPLRVNDEVNLEEHNIFVEKRINEAEKSAMLYLKEW